MCTRSRKAEHHGSIINDMDPLTAIAERRIQEAIERGEFDDLPGKGKPLDLGEDDRTVPAELRMAYRILKNAGLLPPDVELHKEILRLTDLLDCIHDEEGRRERRRELDYKLMKLNMMRRRPVNLEILPEYRERVEEKLSRGGGSARRSRSETTLLSTGSSKANKPAW